MKLFRQVRLAMLTAGLFALLVGSQPAAATTTVTNYFHRNGTYDPYPPTATTPAQAVLSPPYTVYRWTSVTVYPSQVVPSGTYTFTYWATGSGSVSATVSQGWANSPSDTCNVYASLSGTMTAGNQNTISAVEGTYNVPVNTYSCTVLTVNSVQGTGLTMLYDSVSTPTSMTVTS